MKHLQCDMSDDCHEPVTMIEDKGYIYCTKHGRERRIYVGHRNRLMRPWELAILRPGEPLQSYEPISKREHEARKAKRAAAAREGE